MLPNSLECVFYRGDSRKIFKKCFLVMSVHMRCVEDEVLSCRSCNRENPISYCSQRNLCRWLVNSGTLNKKWILLCLCERILLIAFFMQVSWIVVCSRPINPEFIMRFVEPVFTFWLWIKFLLYRMCIYMCILAGNFLFRIQSGVLTACGYICICICVWYGREPQECLSLADFGVKS